MAKIIIVGAGVVGLSVARTARQRGHDVTLIDQGPIPNPRSASYDSHRMIRYQYGAFPGYSLMVHDAFKAWDRLWADLGTVHFVDTGAIGISESEGDYVHKTRKVFEDYGIAHRVLDRKEIEALCPQYILQPDSFGLLAGPAGPLFADRIVTDLAKFVTDLGVGMLPETTVVDIDRSAGSVTLADGQVMTGDVVVVAAGAWARKIIPEYADLEVKRQALLYIAPPADMADVWTNGPALSSFGDRGTYLLPGVGGTDLKFGNGPHRREADPDVDGFDEQFDDIASILDGFRPIIHDIDRYTPLRVQVGYYVRDDSRRFHLLSDARFLSVGNCDGQMFKFGPLMGERVMDAIEGKNSAASLIHWAAGFV